jgi:hypothetical protein
MVFNRANGIIYRGTLECELGRAFSTTFQAAHGVQFTKHGRGAASFVLLLSMHGEARLGEASDVNLIQINA